MGGSSSKHDYHLSEEELNRVKEATGFNTAQVRRLFHRFQVLDVDGVGYLTKDELLRVQEVRIMICISKLYFKFDSSRL